MSSASQSNMNSKGKSISQEAPSVSHSTYSTTFHGNVESGVVHTGRGDSNINEPQSRDLDYSQKVMEQDQALTTSTSFKNNFSGANFYVNNMHVGQGDINDSETSRKENSEENALALPSLDAKDLSENRLDQLKEAVKFYINKKKNEKALIILNNLIDKVEGGKKILLLLQKTTCLIENDQIIEAGDVCRDVSEWLKENLNNEIQPIKEECFQKLQTLITELVEKKCSTSALLLLHRQFELISHFYFDSREKLFKLRDLGGFMQDISKEMQEHGRGCDLKIEYLFMDDILMEMEKVCDVSVKVKSESIAWFLKFYGYLCCEIQDYPKSIDIYNRGINDLNAVFKDNASQFTVYGHYYHNLGTAYKRSDQYDKAKHYFTEALTAYANVYNWADDIAKEEAISNTKKCLLEVE